MYKSLGFDINNEKNLTNEADDIIINNNLQISETQKFKFEQCFFKYLKVKRLLDNYMIPFGFLSAFISGTTVFLFLYFFVDSVLASSATNLQIYFFPKNQL